MSKATQGRSMGNIREMHQPNPVGKLIAWKPDPATKQIWVGVKISDSSEGQDAWTKVNEGVLNGFSIGAPFAEREMRLTTVGEKPEVHVTKYKLAELSLVDNPACPEAFITEIKLAKKFSDTDASFAGELIKRFDQAETPEPRGEEFKPKIVNKTAPVLTENAFVDGDGQVWKRVSGQIVRVEKENSMSDTKVAGTEGAEKRTNIGPVQKPKSGPPGPETPALATAPNPGNKKPGTSDDFPDTAKDADSTNTGRPGGGHDAASKPQVVPKGQGKDAGDIPPPAMGKDADADAALARPGGMGKDAEADADAGMKDADASADAEADAARKEAAGYKFCGICGEGLSKAYSQPMNHQACLDKGSAEKSVTGTPMDQLTKAFQAGVAPMMKAVNEQFALINKRIDILEKSPAPGGPARTELPDGVRSVEKGASSGGSEGEAMKAFEAASKFTSDPFLRDKLSREAGRLAMKAALATPGGK